MIIKNPIEPLDRLGRSIGAGIAGGVSAAAIAYALAPLTKIHLVSVDYTKIHLKNIFSNITLIMLNLTRYYFLNLMPIQPSVVMAGIPMPSISEVSHAMSDRILKYRATGGIFLAHQEGGEQTLRIVGKAFGKNRFIFLTMLDFLFLYGSAKVVDLFVDFIGINTPFAALPSAIPEEAITVDPWERINEHSMDQGREEQHLTFPVITKTRIYTNMYIETYEFTESIENGMNCLTYSIFLRKYTAYYPYKYAHAKTEHGTSIWYYSDNKDDEIISRLRNVDLMMEAGFSTAMIMYRLFQHIAGNSIETSIGHITGININQQNLGIDNTSKVLAKIYTDIDYDLTTLSTPQKEELMQIG